VLHAPTVSWFDCTTNIVETLNQSMPKVAVRQLREWLV
jgi:hypothetical protein